MRLSTWGYLAWEAVRGIRRYATMSLASVSTCAICLLVLAGVFVLSANFNAFASDLESGVQVKAYLLDGIPKRGVEELEALIRTFEGVKAVRFVSKDEAVEVLRRQLGENKDLLEAVEENNPLRDSFDITLVSPGAARYVADKVRSLQGVDKVIYSQDVMDRLSRVTATIRWLGSVLVLALAAAAVVVISNTVRLTVFARRREIGIMRLVGATDRFVQVPFVLEGVFLGLGGAGLASICIWYVYGEFAKVLSESLPFLRVIPREPFIYYLCYGLLGFGAIIGALGAAISVKRFLIV